MNDTNLEKQDKRFATPQKAEQGCCATAQSTEPGCCATAEKAEVVRGGRSYVPAVDIVEQDDELQLVADVPGAKAEDVDLSFERGQLTVHARVARRQNNQTAYVRREYGVGDFVQTFRIGEDIDASKIEAEVKDGVLTLHLPKAEAARSRKIAVKAG